jgi:hypothetical protein
MASNDGGVPMTEPNPCLASAEAFLAAPPDQLAAAVMTVGLGATIQARPADRRVEVLQVLLAIAPVIGVDALKPGRQLHGALQDPATAELMDAVTEGILFGEQRLCLARSFDHDGAAMVRLLRRGRAALQAGDPFTYLR